MIARGRELVATDESTVLSEAPFDAIVVEDSQSDRGLPDSSWADESNRSKVFYKTDDLVD